MQGKETEADLAGTWGGGREKMLEEIVSNGLKRRERPTGGGRIRGAMRSLADHSENGGTLFLEGARKKMENTGCRRAYQSGKWEK